MWTTPPPSSSLWCRGFIIQHWKLFHLSPGPSSHQGKPLRWPWMWLSLYNQNSCPDSLDEWNNLTWEYFNILHDNIHNIHLQIKYFNISHQIHLQIESKKKPELLTNYHIAAYCELRTTSFVKFLQIFPCDLCKLQVKMIKKFCNNLVLNQANLNILFPST